MILFSHPGEYNIMRITLSHTAFKFCLKAAKQSFLCFHIPGQIVMSNKTLFQYARQNNNKLVTVYFLFDTFC